MTIPARAPITQEEADEIISKRLAELESENKLLHERLEARGCIKDCGAAVSLLRVVVRREAGKATINTRRLRAIRALYELDGIADFLGIH